MGKNWSHVPLISAKQIWSMQEKKWTKNVAQQWVTIWRKTCFALLPFFVKRAKKDLLKCVVVVFHRKQNNLFFYGIVNFIQKSYPKKLSANKSPKKYYPEVLSKNIWSKMYMFITFVSTVDAALFHGLKVSIFGTQSQKYLRPKGLQTSFLKSTWLPVNGV